MENYRQPITKVSFELDEHNQKAVILIRFEYDKELIERVKKLTGVRYSSSKKAWYVIDNEHYRQKFNLNPKPIIENISDKINTINEQSYRQFVETLQLKAYSPNTVRTYCNEFAQLLYVIRQHNVNDLTPDRIRSYFLYCINTLQLSENTIHSRINAVKFYYEQVLHRERMFIEIPRPKRPLKLPNVLAISQVEKLFAQLENLKHKTMLYLTYSAGLRISEVVNLKIKDIHSARMVINIKGAKGKKDRMVVLSDGILELLRKYYTTYKPHDWLFEGQYERSQYIAEVYNRYFTEPKMLPE